MTRSPRSALWAAALWVCSTVGCAPAPLAPPAVGLLDVTSRPAERALLAGMTAYENGQYEEAEAQLDAALAGRLVSRRDVAAAHKYLAFLYCSSQRQAECEAAFLAARRADPNFMLSRSEQGHPVWGPVYSRLFP